MTTTTTTTTTFVVVLLESLTNAAAQQAFTATALISLVPNVLLLFLAPATTTTTRTTGHGRHNNNNNNNNNNAGNMIGWQWGQCLAAGGLLGDVFLHTLPHVLTTTRQRHDDHPPHHHDHPHDHDDDDHHHHPRHHDQVPMTGLWILVGFMVFFLMDVVLRMVQDMVLHPIQDKDDDDNDDDTTQTNPDAQGQDHDSNVMPYNGSMIPTSSSSNSTTTTTTTVVVQPQTNDEDKNKTIQSQQPQHSTRRTRRKAWSLILLNLTADALHNFTDGLAIGASYAATTTTATTTTLLLPPQDDSLWTTIMTRTMTMIRTGHVATLSILLHEVPHELGDYCTLVAAGYTPWQAVQTQFGTAIAAFGGTAVALIVAQQANSSSNSSSSSSINDNDNDNHGKDALLLATAGGFVYLAATTLLPHVLAESVAKPWHRLGHLAAFAIGVAFMYGVALLEHAQEQQHHGGHGAIHHHDHHHHHHEL